MLQDLSISHPGPASTKETRYTSSTTVRRKRSKAGCGTCKARKVKCDEAKPVCSRCRSTGRICEGYGVLGGGGNTYLERYGHAASCPSRSNSNITSITLHAPLTHHFFHGQELRYLELYKKRVLWTSAGWFATDFWHAVVLPALVSEPAILHAVVALSAAHPCNFDPEESADARDRFTVKQYSKAICALQPLLRYGDRASVAVVLVACQLFTFLELIRGRHQSAETHLRNGVRLLRDMHCNDDGKVISGVDTGIVRSFQALVTQTSLFGLPFDAADLFLHPLDESRVSSQDMFATPEEAKDALDAILRRITLVSQQQAQKTGCRSEKAQDDISLQQTYITGLLVSWHQTYLRTMKPNINEAPTYPESASAFSLPFGSVIPEAPPPTYTRIHLSYTLLLMYHTMARILTLSLSPGFSESSYKDHTPLFVSILTHVYTISTAYSFGKNIPNNVNLEDSVSESGFIAPLYYTGIKCRVGRIRRLACRLLRVVPHKEGMWDALVAANVVARIIQLEERSESMFSKGNTEQEEEDISLLEIPVLSTQKEADEQILGENLFRSVNVKMLGDNGDIARVTCVRETSGEEVVFVVDNK